MPNKLVFSLSLCLILGGASLAPATSELLKDPPPQQIADPNFKATVDHPAYQKGGPRVLFDEAHNNFHTTTGRYKPFADLITSDGYQVVPNKQPFSAAVLKAFRVLVTSNALGAPRMNDPVAGNPAFTEAECDAV